MRGSSLFILLALGVGCLSTPAAASRLSAQRIEGTNRLCIYDVRSPSRNVRGERRSTGQRYSRVGRGEPCPATYRAPVVPRTIIPSTAVLRGTSVANGRKVCVYHLAGRDYYQEVARAATCPFTPTFVRN